MFAIHRAVKTSFATFGKLDKDITIWVKKRKQKGNMDNISVQCAKTWTVTYEISIEEMKAEAANHLRPWVCCFQTEIDKSM